MASDMFGIDRLSRPFRARDEESLIPGALPQAGLLTPVRRNQCNAIYLNPR